MKKRFNVTGACHPHLHFMADKQWKADTLEHQGKRVFTVWA